MTARFVEWTEVVERFNGKSVAIVGSAPSCLDNEPGFIDSHDVVVRINNHKCGERQGYRTDVHYAFYGTSVHKRADILQSEGVKLCMCKCPNAKALDSEWHESRNKLHGIDYRYIYRLRAPWWFCDTFIPSVERYIEKFELLERHIPTTGFSGAIDILECEPASVYMTGFDFFSSGLHNVDEPWRQGDPSDPIGHRPDLEAQWLAWNAERFPITFDAKLDDLLRCAV